MDEKLLVKLRSTMKLVSLVELSAHARLIWVVEMAVAVSPLGAFGTDNVVALVGRLHSIVVRRSSRQACIAKTGLIGGNRKACDGRERTCRSFPSKPVRTSANVMTEIASFPCIRKRYSVAAGTPLK